MSTMSGFYQIYTLVMMNFICWASEWRLHGTMGKAGEIHHRTALSDRIKM